MEALGAPIPEVAAGSVWAVAWPDNSPSGGFFRDVRPLGW